MTFVPQRCHLWDLSCPYFLVVEQTSFGSQQDAKRVSFFLILLSTLSLFFSPSVTSQRLWSAKAWPQSSDTDRMTTSAPPTTTSCLLQRHGENRRTEEPFHIHSSRLCFQSGHTTTLLPRCLFSQRQFRFKKGHILHSFLNNNNPFSRHKHGSCLL